jgi:hypothetical protein
VEAPRCTADPTDLARVNLTVGDVRGQKLSITSVVNTQPLPPTGNGTLE